MEIEHILEKVVDFGIEKGFVSYKDLKDLLKGKEVRALEEKITFRFFLLTDVEINSIEWLAINMNFFAEYNSNVNDFLLKKLQERVKNIDPTLVARIKELPKLITCSEIDDY